jgi:diacylglycerol kinase family enzyme
MVIILNARAGSVLGKHADLQSKIAALFGVAGINPKIIAADGTKDLTALARDAVTGNEDTIVAAGGDGTVSSVAAVLAGSERTFGVLPLGTLNHFAKDLHIPLDLSGAVRTIIDRHVTAVDVGEVNGRVFVNNSSLGIYPHIVHRRVVEQVRLKLGKWSAFAWATMHAFRQFPFLDLSIEVEGKKLERKTAFLFVGNNKYEITGFRIGARRRLDTGKLGLYLTHRAGRWGLIRLALRALLARLNQEKDFEEYLVPEAFIDARRKVVLVAADGEVKWMESPLHYRSRPGALRVIVPRNQTA